MQPLGENLSNIPAFLGKLWKIVNDPNTDHLICWSSDGNSFIIQNQAQFWYALLPLHYKHNNMSSFVRQLNMYGFHKMSSVENGTMDTDKDEIQFFHKNFQRDQPELLHNIKRKATISKSDNNNVEQNVLKYHDLSKVLTDVKYLYDRQSNVDTQLTTMKQENAVLWRELALLRQKHLKQQQIVNKLIQFLMTLVQPSPTSRMGVGVKRRMPLMLPESPNKKVTNNKNANCATNLDNGPTIHELDSEIEISPEDLFDQDIMENDEAVVSSPQASVGSPSNNQTDPSRLASVSPNDKNPETLLENFWDKPEFVEIEHLAPGNLILSGNDITTEELPSNFTATDNMHNERQVFLNPNSKNKLLSNMKKGSYNSNLISNKNWKRVNNDDNKQVDNDINTFLNTTNDQSYPKRQVTTKINNDTVGTNDCFREDLGVHLETTRSEIDELKDILKGCNSLDANTLLGLFNEDTPSYDLSGNHLVTGNPKDLLDIPTADPMVSGTETITCGDSLIDFNELLDNSLDNEDSIPQLEVPVSGGDDTSINTPLIVKNVPVYPNFDRGV